MFLNSRPPGADAFIGRYISASLLKVLFFFTLDLAIFMQSFTLLDHM